ncbi:MAG: thioredoxin domain-containing protein, partial [Dongiaceae bacterium]
PLATLFNAVDYRLNCLQIVVIGSGDDDATDLLLRVINAQPLPNKLLQVLPAGTFLPPHHPAAGKEMIAGKPTVYLCRGQTCGLPITEADVLMRALSERSI